MEITKNTPSIPEQSKIPERQELTALLEEIDSKITARYIDGKFEGPVILHGQQILDENFNKDRSLDYRTEPGDLGHTEYREKLDPTGQLTALNGMVRDGVSRHQDLELWNTLASSHVLGYLIDKNKSQESTLVLIYPYEFVDAFKRPSLTARVFFKLPTDSLKQLLDIIMKNPDALEEFYQITTDGLDPSIMRYKSSQLAIVDLDTLMPLDKFQFPNIGPNNLYQVLRPYHNRLNMQGLTILQYFSSHGSIDKAEAEAARQEAAQQKQQAEQARQLLQTPKTETPQPQEIPQPLDNPSGLNPDAPLTKLINAGIRLFRPKPK